MFASQNNKQQRRTVDERNYKKTYEIKAIKIKDNRDWYSLFSL